MCICLVLYLLWCIFLWLCASLEGKETIVYESKLNEVSRILYNYGKDGHIVDRV